jgi:hypothetical protein
VSNEIRVSDDFAAAIRVRDAFRGADRAAIRVRDVFRGADRVDTSTVQRNTSLTRIAAAKYISDPDCRASPDCRADCRG